MSLLLARVTIFCFAASYAVALGFELYHLFRPRPILRVVGMAFGAAGLLAHSFYVLAQPLSVSSPFGSLLLLAWILAVFYFYGAIHHNRQAWALFVLPLVLVLILMASFLTANQMSSATGGFWAGRLYGEHFWGMVHGLLVLLAAVGMCVAFVASVMYLVQSHRLKAKMSPGQGVKMLSLERIESMNRRAILASFPILTVGLLVGVVLQLRRGAVWDGWDSPKILSAVGLWVVFAILLYIRYAAHVRGRQAAFWTMAAFVLLLFALVSPVHPFVPTQ